MTFNDLKIILLSNNPLEEIKKNEDELFEYIKELKACKGFNQQNAWHQYDVYEHILHVVNNLDASLNLRLAALFHDIGKPISFKLDENNVGHFIGHWEESRKIFVNFALANNLEKKDIETISKLIMYHDYHLSNLSDLELKNIFTKEEIIMLYKLKRADILAQNQELVKMYDVANKNMNEEKEILKKY